MARLSLTNLKTRVYLHPEREMAEWSIAVVLKTTDCNRSGGSNPSLSARNKKALIISDLSAFLFTHI